MSALNSECPTLDGVSACAPLPSAFVRLRYFFGKRMGVADFVDEQLYHAAKMRFHGQHLHGAGVVCGLRISPLGSNGVRVAKGAALDRCGREIIVGMDQCIDIDAWIARELAARQAVDPNTTWPASDLGADKTLALSVVLRYQECSASPETAPRNPCACDNGGCEFGRIREGFELALLTQAQAQEFVAPTSFPAEADLSKGLAGAVSGAAFDAALARLVSALPPDASGENWLIIGTLKAKLGAGNKTSAVEILPAAPPLLLQTAVLQDLVLRALAAGFEPGALVDGGPQVLTAAAFNDSVAGKLANDAKNSIQLTLSSAIVGATLAGATCTLAALDIVTGWSTIAGGGATTFDAATANSPPTITIPVGAVVLPAAGQTQLLRFLLTADPTQPVCDAQMRSLLPTRFAWDFSIDDQGRVAAAAHA